MIRRISEIPEWIAAKPEMGYEWSSCRQTLESHGSEVNAVVFSADGARLASAADDRTAKLWDVATGQCLQTLEGHSDIVYSVTFSADNASLASASSDHTVKLWDAATGQCLQTLEGHSDIVYSVIFSSDDARLASASDDNTVKLWDAATGQCLQTFHVSRGIRSILSFDSAGSCLDTDIGTLHLSPSLSLASKTLSIPTIPQPSQQRQHSYYRGYGISPDGAWITWNSEKVLWLPQEYRSLRSTVRGSAVALGCPSGRALIFQFSTEPPVSL